MLSLLFDSHFWYLMLIFGFVVAIATVCVKYKQARLFVGVIACVGFVALTGYCAIELNYYYSASGGVFGFIGEKLTTNQVVITDDYTYEVQNLVLLEDEDGKYSATAVVNTVIKLEDNKTYGIFVNNSPATQILQNSEYMQAEYRYQFYDDDAITLLCDDSLKINLAFYENLTTIKISTEGKTNTLDGQSTVNYWNGYFSKNNLEISVKEISYINEDGFNEVEGDVSNFVVVNYYLDGNLYETNVYRQGQAVELPVITVPGKLVSPWQYINGDYYAYSYYALPFEVEGNAIVKYVESDSVVVIPDSYSLISGDIPAYGDSIEITTIKNGCFSDNINTITIGKNITTVEKDTFVKCKNLKRVLIDSYEMYRTFNSSIACGGFFPNTGKVYILADIDDGSNTFLQNYTQVLINDKVYNMYEATEIDINTTMSEVSNFIESVPGQYFADVKSCKLYSSGKVVLEINGYNAFEDSVVYTITFTTVNTDARTFTELWNFRDGTVYIQENNI